MIFDPGDARFVEVRFDSIRRIKAWEFRSMNAHRVILELQGQGQAFGESDFQQLRADLRSNIESSWLRGLGYGLVLSDLSAASADLMRFVDSRARSGGTCQWVIATDNRERQASGVHMWQRGMTTEMYERHLSRLAALGFKVQNRSGKLSALAKLALTINPHARSLIYSPRKARTE